MDQRGSGLGGLGRGDEMRSEMGFRDETTKGRREVRVVTVEPSPHSTSSCRSRMKVKTLTGGTGEAEEVKVRVGTSETRSVGGRPTKSLNGRRKPGDLRTFKTRRVDFTGRVSRYLTSLLSSVLPRHVGPRLRNGESSTPGIRGGHFTRATGSTGTTHPSACPRPVVEEGRKSRD